MTVSMDGLRWSLLNSYNSLTRKLNRSIPKNTSYPEISIPVEDIETQLDEIRNCIITLAYMYDDSEDGFKELENPHFEIFNPQEDDDTIQQ